MDTKEANLEVINLEEFKKVYFSMLSPYFKNIFSNYFQKINLVKVNNQNSTFYYEVVFDEKCANPLKIVHGGALATIIENLSSVSLFYLCKIVYKTIDISINYKNPVPLNKPTIILVKCQKAGANTSFVEVEIKAKDGEVLTQASLIKIRKEKSKNSTKNNKNITNLKNNATLFNNSSIVAKF
jgi:acyl-coenzyme A thioesterase PaaI-like protein